jgi:hypothetical protein
MIPEKKKNWKLIDFFFMLPFFLVEVIFEKCLNLVLSVSQGKLKLNGHLGPVKEYKLLDPASSLQDIHRGGAQIPTGQLVQ